MLPILRAAGIGYFVDVVDLYRGRPCIRLQCLDNLVWVWDHKQLGSSALRVPDDLDHGTLDDERTYTLLARQMVSYFRKVHIGSGSESVSTLLIIRSCGM